jgi:CRP/FNR family transcriptional regulator
MKETLALLRNVLLFSSLTDQQLLKISNTIRIKVFRKNETILHEEDTNEYMYTILSGSVKVIQITDEGRETILAMHKTGFFGEMSRKTANHAGDSHALEDTPTTIISGREFRDLMSTEKVPIISLSFYAQGFANHGTKFRCSTLIMPRIVKMLFTMPPANTAKKIRRGNPEHQLTHQNIANMTGITRTVTG